MHWEWERYCDIRAGWESKNRRTQSRITFFIRYILVLYFKLFHLFWIPPPQKSHKFSFLHLFPNQPLPASPSWYSSTLLHRAFPGPLDCSSFFVGIIWYVNCFLCIPCFWGVISACHWVHTMCVLLWLGYLTQDDIIKFHPLVWEFH